MPSHKSSRVIYSVAWFLSTMGSSEALDQAHCKKVCRRKSGEAEKGVKSMPYKDVSSAYSFADPIKLKISSIK